MESNILNFLSRLSIKSIKLDGQFMGSNDAPYNGRVYYIKDNKKHWISSGKHLEAFKVNFPNDIQWVNREELKKYELAAPISMPFNKSAMLFPNKNDLWMIREIMFSQFSGRGVEFGAACNPLPFPIECNVEYADIATNVDAVSTNYFGEDEDFVPVKYKTSFEDMDGIEDNSLDFIVSGHVIEHLRNPLYALEQGWKKLKNKGKFGFIVPHIEKTFDKNRMITPLSHIIEDYTAPSRERDILNILEFYSKSFVKPIEEIYDIVYDCYVNNNCDLHYHTWNEESFKEMVTYFSENILPFKIIWSQKCLELPEANEFYMVLEKVK